MRESFHEECSLRILRLLMNPVNWPLVKQFIKNSHSSFFAPRALSLLTQKTFFGHWFSGIWYTLMGASFTFEDNIDKDLLHTSIRTRQGRAWKNERVTGEKFSSAISKFCWCRLVRRWHHLATHKMCWPLWDPHFSSSPLLFFPAKNDAA